MERKLAIPVEQISVEALRDTLSDVVARKGVSLLVLWHGEPSKVLLDYEEFVEILDILDELNQPGLLERIAMGRKEYAETGGISLEKLAHDLEL